MMDVQQPPKTLAEMVEEDRAQRRVECAKRIQDVLKEMRCEIQGSPFFVSGATGYTIGVNIDIIPVA